METPRERIQLMLMVVGFTLSVGGVAAFSSNNEAGFHLESDGAVHFSPDSASAVPKSVAVWLIGGGVASLVGAYLLRER